MSEPLSFNEFIDTTASATVDDHLGTLRAASTRLAVGMPVTKRKFSAPPQGQERDQLAAEFDRMKNYILDYYDNGNIKPKTSFYGLGGHPIDCIPFADQPGVRDAKMANHEVLRKGPPAARRKLKAAGALSPKSAPPQAVPVASQLGCGDVDPLGNKMSCPAGHVPLRRITLSQLTRFQSLDSFFRKAPGGGVAPPRGEGEKPDPSQPLQQGGAGEFHRHAHAAQDVANLGLRSSLNVWAPNPDPGVFSLSQIWLTASSGGVLQTIESGWQVYPLLYGDRLPHLFIFFTNNNYQDGSGWYNLSQPTNQPLGFVQFDTPAARSWVIGGALSQSNLGLSTMDGPQASLTIQWQRDTATGNWFLYLSRDGVTLDPVGYYPQQLYGSGPLTTASDRIDFGGEVCSVVANPPSTATGEMGSGQPASAGARRAAFHDRTFFLPTSGGGSLQAASLTPMVDSSDAPYYSISVGLSDNGKREFFYFGGHSAP